MTELTDSVRQQVLAEAMGWLGVRYLYGGGSRSGIDCSHFVATVFQAVVDGWPAYLDVQQLRSSALFVSVAEPKAGDLVSWSSPKHVGIVMDPARQKFIGSQSSTGVAVASYDTGSWWGQRSGMTFIRIR